MTNHQISVQKKKRLSSFPVLQFYISVQVESYKSRAKIPATTNQIQ